jgi:hypothetical protein
MMTDDDEAFARWARLQDSGSLCRNDRMRLRLIDEERQKRALVQVEDRHTRHEQAATVLSDECAQLRDDIATLRSEIDGLRSDVVSGLKAVGESFDQITEADASHGAERDEQLSTLRTELAAARAEAMERTAKATIAVFTEIAAQRTAMDRLIETEREKNAQTLSLAAGREETIRSLQDEISALRNELTVVRVEAAEKLAAGAKASLEAFNEATAQREVVARLLDTAHEELDGFNARQVSLVADVKELKEAQTNFKFARETPNDSEVLDMPAFLLSPGRSVN